MKQKLPIIQSSKPSTIFLSFVVTIFLFIFFFIISQNSFAQEKKESEIDDGFQGSGFTLDSDSYDTIMHAGSDNDTYKINSFGGMDIIDDPNRTGIIKLSGITINATAFCICDENGKNETGTSWQFTHNKKDYIAYRVDDYNEEDGNGKNLLLVSKADKNTANSLRINDFDFVNGGYGIKLNNNKNFLSKLIANFLKPNCVKAEISGLPEIIPIAGKVELICNQIVYPSVSKAGTIFTPDISMFDLPSNNCDSYPREFAIKDFNKSGKDRLEIEIGYCNEKFPPITSFAKQVGNDTIIPIEERSESSNETEITEEIILLNYDKNNLKKEHFIRVCEDAD